MTKMMYYMAQSVKKLFCDIEGYFFNKALLLYCIWIFIRIYAASIFDVFSAIYLAEAFV